MIEQKIDFDELDRELIEIYNSKRNPIKAIEKKIRETIVNAENSSE